MMNMRTRMPIVPLRVFLWEGVFVCVHSGVWGE